MKELVDRDTIYYAFIRLVFIPLLVYVGCKLAGLDDLVTGVSVVLAAMPAASTTAIIASKYKKDEKFATRCVVVFHTAFTGNSTCMVSVFSIIGYGT